MSKSVVDWQMVCLNLQNKYKCLEAVALEVGAGAPHLRRIARGEVIEPRFSTGTRLLDLHFDVCPDEHLKVYRGE